MNKTYGGRNDELMSDVLLWSPTHGCASAGRPVGIYIHQFCAETGCHLEDLPGAMYDRDGWQERERERERENSVLYVRLYGDDEVTSLGVRKLWIQTICTPLKLTLC